MASLESATTTVAARSPRIHDGSASTAHLPEADEREVAEASFRRVKAFSTSAVERFLGLPSGAWKKRRLFALRVLNGSHAEAGIPQGALIVVEPGSRAAPGRLVLVRRATELTVQKVEYDGQGRTVIASAAPGVLPFPTDSGRQTIVGTIIGVLPRARAADRRSAGDRRRAENISSKTRKKKAVPEVDQARHLAILRHNLELWTKTRRLGNERGATGVHVRRRALANRLRVLASCLEVAHQATLYEALADEANRTILAMRREFRLMNTPGGNGLELLEASMDAARKSDADKSATQTATGFDAAKRYRTPPQEPGLDTALTGMV